MVFETFIRYAGLAVGLMVFEKLIRYTGLAVGLKPSAMGCEARLRGRERIMYSKTISHPCGSAARRRDEHTSREGCALPDPPAGGGVGKPGFPTPLLEGQALPRAGAWGNRVPPWSR